MRLVRARRLLAACVPGWRVRRRRAAIEAAVSAVSDLVKPRRSEPDTRNGNASLVGRCTRRALAAAAGGALTCVLLVAALPPSRAVNSFRADVPWRLECGARRACLAH